MYAHAYLTRVMRYTYLMHIFFSGIGGSGIGPLALIAQQAGYEVSGSDKQDSEAISYLKAHGVTDIHIGQDEAAISAVHQAHPIDWFVYSSALPKENPEHPELNFVMSKGIRHSKRDEFLNQILSEKGLKLVAVAGTHGKSTATAMAVWLLKELGMPVSYLVGAKLGFAGSGALDPASSYFIYECDEFDRNFLAFQPVMSLITGIAWDHHEVFPTFENYQLAFKEFIGQSERTLLWKEDSELLGLRPAENCIILDSTDESLNKIHLSGLVNRQDAWLVICAAHELTKEPVEKLIEIINDFPGLARRMELIAPGLYSDYAHNPEKIAGAMQTAMEMAKEKGQKVVVVYEPLTNRRMHFTRKQHKDIFMGASAIYWVPSYLAREDPMQQVLTPAELIQELNPALKEIAKPMELNEQLKAVIKSHMDVGDLVVAMSGGGGHSLDEWLRKEFK
ncbi:UDP-N-acetylmuramate--L-alanine ligase [soil metagenome]